MKHEEFLNLLPRLVADYRPQPAVAAKIAKIELLMVIGPSAAGKTTLINRLAIPYVPSDTTRAPREGEINGRDFNFLDNYDQVVADIRAGEFVQIAIGSAADFFATRASSYPSSGLAVMAVLADVVPVFRKLGFAKTISAFITRADYTAWIYNLRLREPQEAKLKQRMAEAKRSFEFALKDAECRFVLNDKIDLALKRLKQIVVGQPPADETRAKDLAYQNYQKLLAILKEPSNL